MTMPRRLISALFAGLAALTSLDAMAHAHLLSATPADHAIGAAPAQVQLNFSERLLPPASGAELVLTGMPGMSMAPVKVPLHLHFSDDAKSLALVPVQPLTAGSYRVDWHVVSTDTHTSKGSLSFQVK